MNAYAAMMTFDGTMTADGGDDLVARAQRGDIDAFGEIYRENAGRVYAVCLRMVRDRHRAEELTQEAFVRAWKKLGSFRSESAFSTWIHRLAVNVVLSDMRKQTRIALREVSESNEAMQERAAPGTEPGTRLDLEEAIAALPDGARHVLVLHDIEGYRHREIAELLGIAQGTSKAQLHRARRILRDVLS